MFLTDFPCILGSWVQIALGYCHITSLKEYPNVQQASRQLVGVTSHMQFTFWNQSTSKNSSICILVASEITLKKKDKLFCILSTIGAKKNVANAKVVFPYFCFMSLLEYLSHSARRSNGNLKVFPWRVPCGLMCLSNCKLASN